jgi:hypothetical protein
MVFYYKTFDTDLNSQYNIAVKIILAHIKKSYLEGTDYIPIFAIGDGLQTILVLEMMIQLLSTAFLYCNQLQKSLS